MRNNFNKAIKRESKNIDSMIQRLEIERQYLLFARELSRETGGSKARAAYVALNNPSILFKSPSAVFGDIDTQFQYKVYKLCYLKALQTALQKTTFNEKDNNSNGIDFKLANTEFQKELRTSEDLEDVRKKVDFKDKGTLSRAKAIALAGNTSRTYRQKDTLELMFGRKQPVKENSMMFINSK